MSNNVININFIRNCFPGDPNISINISTPLLPCLYILRDLGEVYYYFQKDRNYIALRATPLGAFRNPVNFSRYIVKINQIFKATMNAGLFLGQETFYQMVPEPILRSYSIISSSITLLTGTHLYVAAGESRMLPKIILSVMDIVLYTAKFAFPNHNTFFASTIFYQRVVSLSLNTFLAKDYFF